MSSNPSTSSAAGGGGGGGSGGSGGGSGSSGGGPCGACKFLRRKCVPGCIFAPYFDSEQGAAHFAAVHKVFGASNVSKLLLHIPVHKRLDAVITICYEAQSRLRDPVYGCVAHIFALQQQVVNLQAELAYLQAHLATLEAPTPPLPSAPPSQPQLPLFVPPPVLNMADLPTGVPIMPATYDLSSLFDPMVQPAWTIQPRQLDPRQLFGGGAASSRVTTVEMTSSASASSVGGGGDLQELARELMHRRGSPTVPCTNAPSSSALPPHSK